MTQVHQVVVFTLDGQRYATLLSAVERIVRTVEITPVPRTPEIVLGVINAQGWIIPVIDVRKRLRLPQREPQLSDQMLIARTLKRQVALVVDTVTEVVTLSAQEVIPGDNILPHLEPITGVAKSADGLIFIHDLDAFLSLEEAQALDEALDPMHR
jgi:purine-binding chemotaxis protein CheW